MRRKTHEEFLKELSYYQGERFTVISQYETAKVKLYIKCNICGSNDYKIPNDILKGSCKECHRKRLSLLHSKTHEEFKKEVEETNEYVLLSLYKNSKEKVEIKHVECGYSFKMIPSKFTSGQRCPKCMRANHNRSHKQFLDQFLSSSNDEYDVLGKFTTVDSKTLIRHKKCGYEYKVSPHKFINGGRRCPKCANNIKLKQNEFEERVNEIDPEYTVVGRYIGTSKKVLLKHLKCGYVWGIKPINFYHGKRCPRCKYSKGEKAIEHYLIDNEFDYEPQHKINECKLDKPLPFDFVVFKDNKKYLIEFQGEQHYKAIDFFGGIEAFEIQKTRDHVKLNFCKQNNIPFVTIPYYEIENIPIILKDFL